jgi:Zn finger protein HypA/HybF involved in hydrogenase expression
VLDVYHHHEGTSQYVEANIRTYKCPICREDQLKIDAGDLIYTE